MMGGNTVVMTEDSRLSIQLRNVFAIESQLFKRFDGTFIYFKAPHKKTGMLRILLWPSISPRFVLSDIKYKSVVRKDKDYGHNSAHAAVLMCIMVYINCGPYFLYVLRLDF